jgi:integrase
MAGKAAHRGFGHIRRLPSGRWQASYIGPDLVRHTAPTTFDDKDTAIVWLSKERGLIEADAWTSPKARKAAVSRHSFADYSRAWVESRRTRSGPIKPRTKAHYLTLLDRVLIPAFGEAPVRILSPEAVDVWYATLDPSTPTLNAHAYALLKSICKTAVEKKILTVNPCQITGAGNAKRARKIEPATLAELEAIVAAVPRRYQLMILLASWCALRFGELTELRRSDLDLKNGVIKVRRGVVWVKDNHGIQPVIGTPKSDAGIRDVNIPPHLMAAVRDHLAAMPVAGRDALLFPSAGDPHSNMRPATLAKVYYAARQKAGRPDLPFHGLRHTGAVLAAQTGATLAELMSRLGHSTPGAAMRYQHAAKGRDAEIAAALSAMVTSTGLTPAATK